MRKIILSALGVLLIVASYYGAKSIIGSKNKLKPVAQKVVKTVFVDTVKNSTVNIVIPANGKLVAKHRVALYAEVQGVFKSSSNAFKPGQTFKKGEQLIGINSSEYFASVQSAKSNLYNSIAAIMPDLKLDFPEVFPKWKNYLKGFNLNKTTPQLPERTSEKENYFITGRGIITDYYNVKNLEQRLRKYNIHAPFNGILIEALVTKGSLIRSGQKLGEFIDPSIYEMEVAISKTFAKLLKVGETVALNSIDTDATYAGKVTRVNGSIDATTQTITAFIEVKHNDLKEGLYLEASLNAKQEPNAIELNRNLLLENNQIYVLKDSLLDVIDVKPIYFTNTKMVIKNIPDNTIILKKPVPGAYTGMAVKPYTKNKYIDEKAKNTVKKTSK
jgi:multidrug efflux pump subunit AcrA (membrane-fusion protein)